MASKKKGKGKYMLIVIFMLITTSVITYIYSNRIENTVADLPYPYEVVYDFEGDVIGEFPNGWLGSQWNGTEVIAWEKDESHGQVAEVRNRDGNSVEVATRFKKAKSGAIEFDIYCMGERINIDVTQLTEEYDSADDICINIESDGRIMIKDYNGFFTRVSCVILEQWCHFKIEFNLDYWELWVDGEHILFYQGFYINYQEIPSYLCQLYFATYVDDNWFYVDNVEITVIETI